MAANHSAAATLFVIASLLVAVALSGADARPTTVPPNKTPAAALRNAHEQGNVAESSGPPPPEMRPDTEPACSTCEPEPKPKPKPEPEPELTCKKVHGVKKGETCYSVGQCAGLGLDDFLRINPNICCDDLFVGQWVCLEATCA